MNRRVRLPGIRVTRAVFCVTPALAAGALTLSAGGKTVDDATARIARLEGAVLAPCRYTEPVSRHQSEIAVKMRLEVTRWVAEGRTDPEILGAYVQRYGSNVLVDPRTRPGWWTPWVPCMAAILATGFGLGHARHWQAKPAPAAMADTGFELPAQPDCEVEE